jgi:hypothetical protein
MPIMMTDKSSSTPPSVTASDQRDGEKHDVLRVEEASGPGLTTLDGGVVTMTWKTWLVIFVRQLPIIMPFRLPHLLTSARFFHPRLVCRFGPFQRLPHYNPAWVPSSVAICRSLGGTVRSKSASPYIRTVTHDCKMAVPAYTTGNSLGFLIAGT